MSYRTTGKDWREGREARGNRASDAWTKSRRRRGTGQRTTTRGDKAVGGREGERLALAKEAAGLGPRPRLFG